MHAAGNKNGGPNGSDPPKEFRRGGGSDVGLGFAQALNAVASLPLAALFKQVDALEALEDVAFLNDAADALQTFVL
jgi:hypothetical protein